MGVFGGQGQVEHLTELGGLRERRFREGRLALEGMQHNSLEQIAEGDVQRIGDAFNTLSMRFSMRTPVWMRSTTTAAAGECVSDIGNSSRSSAGAGGRASGPPVLICRVLLRKAAARLVASPLFTAFAVLSLAAGVAVTTAVYSVVDTLLFARFEALNPHRWPS